ncbi:MAG: cytochrome b/b6 domain-containing protein [Rhodospirillales bacterium]|nr:cytochrome b/b6 domain-containing protein [Rhodospirillales bacterium]
MDGNLYPYPSQADAKQPLQATLVWDLPLRLFHWAMVCVVAVAGVTGFLAPEWWLDLHVIAGYALGTLLTFRLAWGFLGSHYSKFWTFPLTRGGAYRHLRAILDRKPQDHAGHNPAGAWMIILLLIVLVSLVATGLVVLGGQENLGPLASAATFQTGEIAAKIHEIAAWGLVGAVVLHLLGVFVETRIFRHPVLAAMITGKKVTAELPPGAPPGMSAVRGGILFLAVTALLLAGGRTLAGKFPSGWRAVQAPAAYTTECGDCHHAHHPSLRTRQAWRALMNGLPDHYGEDASLDAETVRTIRAYLDANPAGTFDTEAAQRVGRIETSSFRMTDVPYWKARHQSIAPSVFRLTAVGSKVNCNGCHKDAASGRFDDVKIHLPTGDKK